ncbi:hypothetical protein [Francisella sp. 19X1-34]|uniref:hypothetical protein n=1 Tax=Francisella sp. 19X1-34 TaxID=3087177 RepID=UPI002E300920|nr:hypothetical protein [Francisella sp. 19X1-34]MED7789632.1 hypothetical protein [Francisella sp. 19X1-34]
MYKKILFTFILGYLYTQLGFTISLPNYDKLAITPTTWKEVELKAYDYINSKRYRAEIKLLRPISWLKTNHLDKVGNKGNFSLPEFNIKHMYVTVVALKPTKLDTSKINWSKQSSYPVIGTFKRYAPVVKTYTFKDLTTGKISKVTSTLGHKYYVKNRTVNNIIGKNTHYISISRVRSDDTLISQAGDKIKLICPINKTSHCGELYNKDHKPINVYNLEIYNKHHYFVGKINILVHNVKCTTPITISYRASTEEVSLYKATNGEEFERGNSLNVKIDTEFKNLNVQLLPYKDKPEGQQVYLDDTEKYFTNEQGEKLSGKFNFITINSKESPQNPFLNSIISHSGHKVDLYIDPILHHDNIASGKAVTYAGTVEFDNGMVVSWDNKSGHYQPLARFSDQSPFDLKKFQPWED